jgi:lipopolysaccharide transport protein LptA
MHEIAEKNTLPCEAQPGLPIPGRIKGWQPRQLPFTCGATLIALLLLGQLSLPPAAAQSLAVTPQGEEQPAAEAASSRETTVRAKSVDMNFTEHMAVFDGDVEVADGQMTLTSDHMVVHLTTANELQKIIATGNVIIINPEQDRRATAGRAEYNVTTGAIELTEEPRLEMGGNRLENADKITYFRDSGRVTTEGGTITFMPGEGGRSVQFFGRDTQDDQQ